MFGAERAAGGAFVIGRDDAVVVDGAGLESAELGADTLKDGAGADIDFSPGVGVCTGVRRGGADARCRIRSGRSCRRRRVDLGMKRALSACTSLTDSSTWAEARPRREGLVFAVAGPGGVFGDDPVVIGRNGLKAGQWEGKRFRLHRVWARPASLEARRCRCRMVVVPHSK